MEEETKTQESVDQTAPVAATTEKPAEETPKVEEKATPAAA